MHKKIFWFIYFGLALFYLQGCSIPFYSSTATGEQQKSTEKYQNENKDQINPEHQTNLLKILALARQGKVIGCDFVVHKSTFSAVKQRYGQPDERKNKKLPYFRFGKQNLAFGVEKNDVIFEIRSYDRKIREITRSEVVKTLGVPNQVQQNPDESVYRYHINGYIFKLVFDIKKDEPTIHHTSVYAPSVYNQLDD